jgi:hypothetical protein
MRSFWGSSYSHHIITAQLEHGSRRGTCDLCGSSPFIPFRSYCASTAQHLQALVQHVLLYLFGRWRDVGVGCWWSSHLGVSPIAFLAFCGAGWFSLN